jgi:two-component system phosphate regulon response regulator PhoB
VSTILIVDDEAPVRELLGLLLGDAGHRPVLASNGGQALALVESDPPDLVISDVMMPVLGGVELCRRLKGRAATRAIPVILMSSAGRRVADGAGADAFIDKPFDLATVEALVRRWLARPAGPAPLWSGEPG